MNQYCSACGAANRPAARFCNQCGASLPGLPAPEAPAPVESAPAPWPPAPQPEALQPEALQPEAVAQPAPEPAPEPIPEPAPDAAPQSPPLAAWEAAGAPWPETPPFEEEAAAQAAPAPGAGWDGAAQAETLAGAEAVAEPVAAPVAAPVAQAVAEPTPEPVAEPVAEPGVEAVPAPALPDPGEVLGGRYWVIAHAAEGGVLVEDHGVCRACGQPAPLPITPEEPYCMECGAHLLDAPAPWPQRRLIPAGDDAALPPGAETVEWLGGLWAVLPAEQDAGAPDGSAPAAFARGVTLLAGQRSDVGLLRAGRPDEDSLFSLTLSAIFDSQARPTLGLYFVADGMGGHGDGEVASRTACESLLASLLPGLLLPLAQGHAFGDETIGSLLDAAIQLANRRVVEKAQDRGNDMGTTLTLALVVDDAVYVANVGDSRTYLWHGGALRRVSEDHSAVFQLAAQRVITEDEIYTHPRRNEIYRSLGLGGSVQVDFFRETLAPGDALLLCCDGLWEMVRSEGIADVLLAGYGDPQTICDELIRRANQAGGEDNVSVIVVRALA